MRVSVVTVCLNSERTIEHTIRSFVEQLHSDKELILVDGGSTDRTLDIVRAFRDPAIRIVAGKDRGIYDAMNKGLKAYGGDAIGFLNSDDAFHDAEVLGRIAAALEDADAVYGDIVFVGDHIQKRVVRRWNAGPFRRGSFRWGWMPPHPTFYIRRGLAERVGLFDLQYGASADYDFMLRALEVANADARYIPHTLVDFMQGGQSTAKLSRYVEGNLQCLKSRRRHLGAAAVDLALFLKPLRKSHQFRWLFR